MEKGETKCYQPAVPWYRTTADLKKRAIISNGQNNTRAMRRTGLIWQESPTKRVRLVDSVCKVLEGTYGKPRFGNPHDPLDDLIYVTISNRTAPVVAQRIYKDLKTKFSVWDDLLASSKVELMRILEPAGLAAVKSQQIWASLEKIRQDNGSCDLGALQGQSEEEIEQYLVSLPGVSLKVAKCVMMYTLGKQVLPVDSHVHRVTKRLGWHERKRADQCHEELEALVRPTLRYALHVDCIAHGRLICRPKEPRCEQCCLNQYCAYYSHAA